MVMSMCRAKQILGGHKQNLVHTRTEEKGAVTTQETDPDLSRMSRSLQQRHGLVVACCRVGALSVAGNVWDLLKEVPIIFITSSIG